MSEASGSQHTVADVRAIAYRYLGIREHSCQQLREKLLRKGLPEDIVFMTVDELAEEGLVSDQRFAEAFTRSRVQRLQGPVKIRAELLRHGVSDALIAGILSVHESEWRDLALEWASKRVRENWDRNEKARLYRSGMRRGFSHDHMMRAIESLEAIN